MNATHRTIAEQGFTLIEALIALLVLSIGMLGIAALYLDSLRAGRSALWRTQAVDSVGDIADRIRSNPLPLSASNAEGGAAYEIAFGATPSVNCNPTGTFTDPKAAARNDVACWADRVATALPDGEVAIDYQPATDFDEDAETPTATGLPNAYEISVRWTEPGNEVGSFFLRIEDSPRG